jgi:hypothetical protein
MKRTIGILFATSVTLMIPSHVANDRLFEYERQLWPNYRDEVEPSELVVRRVIRIEDDGGIAKQYLNSRLTKESLEQFAQARSVISDSDDSDYDDEAAKDALNFVAMRYLHGRAPHTLEVYRSAERMPTGRYMYWQRSYFGDGFESSSPTRCLFAQVDKTSVVVADAVCNAVENVDEIVDAFARQADAGDLVNDQRYPEYLEKKMSPAPSALAQMRIWRSSVGTEAPPSLAFAALAALCTYALPMAFAGWAGAAFFARYLGTAAQVSGVAAWLKAIAGSTLIWGVPNALFFLDIDELTDAIGELELEDGLLFTSILLPAGIISSVPVALVVGPISLLLARRSIRLSSLLRRHIPPSAHR